MSIIPYSKQSISADDIQAVKRVLKSDFLTQGPKVPEFERALARYFGTKYAICCSSGTAALHLAYSSLGASPSSIAIVPAITFAATANAFRYLGSDVIFCDVVPETGHICIHHLEKILSSIPKLKNDQKGFIAPVSFAGAIAPLERCNQLASRYNFQVIEDASHAVGAWTHNENGKKKVYAGACIHTQASCLSFHPVKHVCCGEGGAVLTNSTETANTARKLRSHGIERPFDDEHDTPWYYQQVDLGWNYRMTDLQAALGMSQLSRIEDSLKSRKEMARRYIELLSVERFSGSILLPVFNEGHAWHLFIIRFCRAGMRNRAYKYLKSKHIHTQVHYIPVYKHPYYQTMHRDLQLSGSEDYFESCLSIPMYSGLTLKQQNRVIAELDNFLAVEK
ncbi:MAG: aminotransferase class I/II-fold pyridoxal phosphate-dependent enzyme [Opitutales bacterium]|nr:aminotransferase class I/II-fold pyridoxal phosphate-dependent enzyme [Opitutales bacterium]